MIRALVSDFGGVITLPLGEAFARATTQLGFPARALGEAMGLLAARSPEPPLFALERGELPAEEFVAGLAEGLEEVLERPVVLDGLGERLMGALETNEPLLAYYRALRERGIRLAILTNNVREWQPLWRERLRIDELFELVVDSGFEGVRKPDPAIYARVLERLELPGESCVFVDDLEVNLPPARAAGMHPVHFRDAASAIREIDALVL